MQIVGAAELTQYRQGGGVQVALVQQGRLRGGLDLTLEALALDVTVDMDDAVHVHVPLHVDVPVDMHCTVHVDVIRGRGGMPCWGGLEVLRVSIISGKRHFGRRVGSGKGANNELESLQGQQVLLYFMQVQ